MSSAAEEAMERAKAIAARLSGESMAPAPAAASTASDLLHVANAAQAALATAAVGNGAVDSSSSKRKRWGVSEQDSDAPPVAALPGLEDAAKRLKQASVVEPRRIWVSTNTRPASHFMLYLSQGDKLNGIASIHPTLKVELKGRGSSRTAPPTGMPEEPLHVLIQGEDQAAVMQAETMVEDLLRQAETATLQQDAIVPTYFGTSRSRTCTRLYSGSSCCSHSWQSRRRPNVGRADWSPQWCCGIHYWSWWYEYYRHAATDWLQSTDTKGA